MTFSSYFQIQPGLCPGEALYILNWDLACRSLSKEIPQTLAYKQFDGVTVPAEVFLPCHGAIYLGGENR